MKTLDCMCDAMSDRSHCGELCLDVASDGDREEIYRIRHAVYATELGQHPENDCRSLRDSLDEVNQYIVARRRGRIVGFVSITPPGCGRYSIDKYVAREDLPFPCDDGLYEVRLLTVAPPYRRGPLAGVLMYGAFRWVEAQGGTRIVAIGRREVLSLYRKIGFRELGRTIRCGAVQFELMEVNMADGRRQLGRWKRALRRVASRVDWRLPMPWVEPQRCEHGGMFFQAIGEEFRQLQRHHEVINADVLDAWFPPAPAVLAQLRDHLDWILRTSPPTGCEGMIRAIARARGVPIECLVPGAGSSNLIFRAFRQWLTPRSRVLTVDPAYGEYVHVLEHLIGCRVDRLCLDRREGYRLDLATLEERLHEGYDLLVLVNPNNPTGVHVRRAELEPVLRRVPARTRVWIDEAYIDYVDPGESLERFAAASQNVVVAKSMSKVYALSGVRAAYLCAAAATARLLLAITPPWAVSLPGQIAAVAALASPEYYAGRYRETHQLRGRLATALDSPGPIEVCPGVANFLLCRLRGNDSTAAELIARCRRQGLFLRDVGSMTNRPDAQAFRVAVKDDKTNARIVEILSRSIASP